MLPEFAELHQSCEKISVVKNKCELHEWTANFVGSTNALDYIEFGVFKGETLSFWLESNSNQDSRFFGFDSFEGLPENWQRGFEKGTFNLEGTAPEIEDSRVTFVKGWFQETLRDFIGGFEPSGQLVVHHDADLYSSTLFCLAETDRLIKPNSIVILDDFAVLVHVFRAYKDYCKAFCRSFEVLCATPKMATVALRSLPMRDPQS
jgi:O-methyltransferase